MEDIKTQLNETFCRVFDDDDLVITDDTTASDIAGWDSIAHLNLVISIEKKFGIRFSAPELGKIKKSSVGELLAMIEAKKSVATGQAK